MSISIYRVQFYAKGKFSELHHCMNRSEVATLINGAIQWYRDGRLSPKTLGDVPYITVESCEEEKVLHFCSTCKGMCSEYEYEVYNGCERCEPFVQHECGWCGEDITQEEYDAEYDGVVLGVHSHCVAEYIANGEKYGYTN
jgi:hypothetical protein